MCQLNYIYYNIKYKIIMSDQINSFAGGQPDNNNLQNDNPYYEDNNVVNNEV